MDRRFHTRIKEMSSKELQELYLALARLLREIYKSPTSVRVVALQMAGKVNEHLTYVFPGIKSLSHERAEIAEELIRTKQFLSLHNGQRRKGTRGIPHRRNHRNGNENGKRIEYSNGNGRRNGSETPFSRTGRRNAR